MKKAEMGVGTLIVFIAMLLVAAVAAGVLIQTAGSLQEKSLSTGQQAKAQISTNARVVEISASDGRNGNLTDFQQVIKLSPGSDPIKIDQIIFTFNTKDRTSTLKYRGTDSLCAKNNSNGYNTWNVETLPELENFKGRDTSEGPGQLINHLLERSAEVDLDDDGTIDTVGVCAGGSLCPAPYDASDSYMIFNLSQDGPVYVLLRNDDGSLVNLSQVGTADSAMSISRLNIGTYGYINASRASASNVYTIWSLDNGAAPYFRIFENPYVLDEDLDDDGLDDEFAVEDTNALLMMGSGEVITIPLGFDITAGTTTFNIDRDLGNSTDNYAHLSIAGTMTDTNYLPANSVTITPQHQGEGYFSVIYETEGTNHVAGNLQRGDIVRLCYESPGEITEDELIRLNFIPKIGTPTLTEFITPDVISTERIYLYP